MTINEYITTGLRFEPVADRPFEGVDERVQWLANPESVTITLAPQASLKLLVLCTEPQSCALNVVLNEGAHLTMATLFVADAKVTCHVEANTLSRLRLTSLQNGSSSADYTVDLGGAEADSVVNALFALGGEERSRLSVRTNHLVPDCHSSSEVRGLAGGESVGSFEGMVYVAPDAQHTEAFQQNRNMLLSPTARIDTKPQLEIYADDVMCSHGATVGQMDQEAIYYMRQRGLDDLQARRLQLTGFADDLVMRCGCDELCGLLLDELNKKLDTI